MGTWGTTIKDNDAFADVYDEFFELYNKGELPLEISEKIIKNYWEMLQIEEEKHNLWFALALAQWETKSLDSKIFQTVENIVLTGADLKIWSDLGASDQDIERRKTALDKFLEKLKSERPKAKPRRRIKQKSPVFSTGDCIAFKLKNGHFGGAVVLATDRNPKTGNNLVATTRLNCSHTPTPKDFENAEVLLCNFAQWQDHPEITWRAPDLYHKDYGQLYQRVGTIEVEIEYDPNDYEGKGYLFRPSWTAAWNMKDLVDRQFESELFKAKPGQTFTIQQLPKKST